MSGVGSIGAKEKPRRVEPTGIVVGTSMSIAREGGENEKEGEEETQG